MNTLRFTWKWQLASALHHGSGLSSPGYADRLIQRDGVGRPYITGDAVKGAIRMSAEALTHLPGSGFDAADAASMIDLLFGATADAHFEPARPTTQTANRTGGARTIAQTSVDPKTGAALDNTLRKTEVLSKGRIVESGATFRLDGQDAENTAKLGKFFVFALAGTEWIGARTGAGWGAIKLTELIDLSNPTEVVNKAASTVPLDGAKDRWYRLTLELQETTCLGAKPSISNDLSTLDFIPATAMRGALRASWKRASLDDEFIEARIGSSSRWSPAFPIAPDGEDVDEETQPTYVPWPASRIVKKGEPADPGSRAAPATHDVLWGPPPDENAQWRRSQATWLDPKTPATGSASDKISTSSTMHLARDYETGSKVEGALYTREHIDPTGPIKRFAALIRMDTTDKRQLPETIELGKRKSAGHGLAKCTWTEVDGNIEGEKLAVFWGGTCSDPQKQSVIAQLLSPAIVRGNGGMPLRGLDLGAWNRLLGEKDNSLVSSCRSITTLAAAQSFMSTWGHGRAAVPAIGSGSVWRLTAAQGRYEDLKKALEALSLAGLGERRHEGYGWIAVDPVWFAASKKADTSEKEAQA